MGEPGRRPAKQSVSPRRGPRPGPHLYPVNETRLVTMRSSDTIPSFEEVTRFHGHGCPGLALDYRIAVTALRALGGDRAPDEELVAVVENDSCAVDAIQVVTG